MIRYEQRTGKIFLGDAFLGTGYSGAGDGVNNPDKQDVRNVGPIPRGKYALGRPVHHSDLGPFAIPLYALPGTITFGRSGFYIHGDNSTHNASKGCIVASRFLRNRMNEEASRTLEVYLDA